MMYPIRRRSETNSKPTEIESARTWVVSMIGNTQMDSRIDVPMYVSCNHWHALKMDIDMQVWRTSVSDATLKRLAVEKRQVTERCKTAAQQALDQTFGLPKSVLEISCAPLNGGRILRAR